MASQEFALGAVVDVTAGNGGRGVVRFCGATSFAAGKWVGVELNDMKGKNDGTVNGVRYFSCKMNYGVFARPSQVKLVKATPEPRPSLAPAVRSYVSTGLTYIEPALQHIRPQSIVQHWGTNERRVLDASLLLDLRATEVLLKLQASTSIRLPPHHGIGSLLPNGLLRYQAYPATSRVDHLCSPKLLVLQYRDNGALIHLRRSMQLDLLADHHLTHPLHILLLLPTIHLLFAV